jgi:hypothetical protein
MESERKIKIMFTARIGGPNGQLLTEPFELGGRLFVPDKNGLVTLHDYPKNFGSPDAEPKEAKLD